MVCINETIEIVTGKAVPSYKLTIKGVCQNPI